MTVCGERSESLLSVFNEKTSLFLIDMFCFQLKHGSIWSQSPVHRAGLLQDQRDRHSLSEEQFEEALGQITSGCAGGIWTCFLREK